MTPTIGAQTAMPVYGLWHCYSDACSWASVLDATTFDTDNHWIVDRGNGSPSVNLVVLSFVNPVKLMSLTNDSTTVNGISIEIDYEKNSGPNLTGPQQFVTAYRSVVPYDAVGSNFAPRLTIHLGDGDTYLTATANYATVKWRTTFLIMPTRWWPRKRRAGPLSRPTGSNMSTECPVRCRRSPS
jgi:hypothetical protein